MNTASHRTTTHPARSRRPALVGLTLAAAVFILGSGAAVAQEVNLKYTRIQVYLEHDPNNDAPPKDEPAAPALHRDGDRSAWLMKRRTFRDKPGAYQELHGEHGRIPLAPPPVDADDKFPLLPRQIPINRIMGWWITPVSDNPPHVFAKAQRLMARIDGGEMRLLFLPGELNQKTELRFEVHILYR